MRASTIRWAVFAAALLCAAAAVRAQQPVFQQPTQNQNAGPMTAMIAGRIVDAANGSAIAGANVALLGGAPVGRGGAPRQLQTDSEGRFVFAGLPQGRFSILVQRAGYFVAPITTNRSIELAVEQKLTDLTLRMRRLGAISGTVSDENGDLVTGMTVVAYRRSIVNGQVMALPSGEARTDDRGAYRLANLQPGDYVMCACRMDPIPFDGVLLTTLAADPAQLLGLASRALKVGADVATIEGARAFAPTFHPASPLMSRATHVMLNDGENKQAVDVQVAVVRAARLSGRVVGAPISVTANAIRLRFAGEMPEASSAIEPALVQPDGRFDFIGVTPGSYVLSAWLYAKMQLGNGPSGTLLSLTGGRGTAITPPPPPPPPGSAPVDDSIVSGQTLVVVGDSDVTGVSVSLRPAARVTINWDLPAGLPAPPPNQPFIRSVQLTPLPFEARSVRPIGRLNPDGTSTMSAALPGRYGLVVQSGLRLERVTLRGEDITDLPIEVGETDVTDLVVTMVSGAGAKISGTVAGNSGDNCVLLFPADRKLWAEPGAARRWFATLPVSRAGAFASDSSLPAGEYFAVLVPDEEAADWQMRSHLETLAPRALRVRVNAGETKVIEVKR